MLPNEFSTASRHTMERIRDTYGAYRPVRENNDGHSIFRYSRNPINEYVIGAWFVQELRKELKWFKK